MRRILRALLLVFIGLLVSFIIFVSLNYSTPILMYHSFDPSRVDSYAAVSPEVFLKQMESIKAWGYKPMALSDYCRMLKNKKTLPPKTIVLTADDGYKDNLAAIEVLNRFNYPITLFLIVNHIGDSGYLSIEDIDVFLKKYRGEIGSHTVNHKYLPDLTVDKINFEIKKSRIKLENQFQRKVYVLSYPIGGFNQKVLKSAKESGYLCACTTNRGFSKKINRFGLRRIKVTNRDLGFRLWAKLSGFYNALKRPKKPD